MKKSSLTTAVLAGLAGLVGFAGSSNAVELNPDGTGQVLIYPYYTVNAGQQTYISVVNSTEHAKAVKVRFLEAYNSREVRDFNLFLSPYDVWTGTIFAMDDAGLSSTAAAFGTTDTSCTVPSLYSGAGTFTAGALHAIDFTNYAFAGDHSDSGPTDLDRTREGYAELISMADIVDGSATAKAVTHVAGVPPGCGSASLRDLANQDFIAPTGGLFGAGAVINVAEGTLYPYVADAVDGFTSTPLITNSGDLRPNLGDANTLGVVGAQAHVFLPGGTAVTATYADGIDAVSAVFQAKSLMNEWIANADAGQGTDWVVTFPTKRFYVDPEQVNVAGQPFVELFGDTNDGQSCTQVGINKYDREEGQPVVHTDDDFSPAPPGQPPSSLCHEVNVISISASTDPVSVLGSTMALNVPPYGNAGWMRLDLNPAPGTEPHTLTASNEGIVFNGLPATGFAAERYINSAAQPGKLSNYSGAWRHRVERQQASSTAP